MIGGVVVGHGFSRFQGSRYVDEPLVAAAPETETLVAQVLTEASVDQHVDILQQKALARVFEQLFEGISGVAPDVLVAFFLDGTGQLGEALRLEHGVASAEGDVGKGIVEHFSRISSVDMRRPWRMSHDSGLWQPGHALGHPAA